MTESFKQPIRLVEAINWNRIEDPKDLDVWNRLTANLWLPEKIPLSNDVVSWNTLTDKEQELTVRVFAGLTMLDTIQSTVGAIRLMSDARTPHEEAVYTQIAYMESVHARSYSSIFATLCSSEVNEKAFRWSRENVFIQKKAELILERYAADDPLKVKIASVFLESFLFYSGFYLPLYWASRAKLTNTADLIKLILKDECLTDDHELLTPDGWKNISEITTEDLVGQFDPDTNAISFVHPTHVSQHEAEYTWEFASEQGHLRQSVSPKHRMFLKKKTVNGVVSEVVEADDMETKHFNFARSFQNAGIGVGTGPSMTVEERLLIAIQADGCFDTTTVNTKGELRRTGAVCGTIPCKFSFSKRHKIERIKTLAAEAGWQLNLTGIREADGNVKERENYILRVPHGFNVQKKLSDLRALDEVSYEWAVDFIDELANWDGYRVPNSTRITWGCVDKDNVDYVQAICALAGYRSHYGCRVDNRSETFRDYHRLQINPQSGYTSSQCVTRKKGPARQVYGVQVPTTFLLTRNQGSVSITGNCIHGYYIGYKFQLAFNELAETEQEEIRSFAYELLMELYDNEVLYTESLYDEVGLTEDVKHFLHYNANKALMNLGFDALFPAEATQVAPTIMAALGAAADVNHDFFSGSGSSYVMGKSEALTDDEWAF